MKTVSEYVTYDSIRYYDRVLSSIPILRLHWHRNRLRKEGCPNKELEELLSGGNDKLELVLDILHHYFEDNWYDYTEGGEDGMEVVHDFYTSKILCEYHELCTLYSKLRNISVDATHFYQQALKFVERHLGWNGWGVRLQTENPEFPPAVEIIYYAEQALDEIALLAGMLDVDYFFKKNTKKMRKAIKKVKRQIRRKREKKDE